MENTVGAGKDTILAQVQRFSAAHGKELTVAGTRWRYYRLGSGPAVVWLTGGLRRAALGYAFLELMGRRYTILAPDYPPIRTAHEFDRGSHRHGQAGHIACLLAPDQYVTWLEQALAAPRRRA